MPLLSLACRAAARLDLAARASARPDEPDARLARTVLLAWSALVGISLVFVQLTQFQGFRPAGHPIVGWCYADHRRALWPCPC